MTINQSEWQWFGNPGHFICAFDCRFHLCTLVGVHLVSTVGELFWDEPVREITAKTRGITLRGMGDARKADYMKKIGFENIGWDRKYESMVFKVTGDVCHAEGCSCGLPVISPSELDGRGYNTAGDANRGHLELCMEWGSK